MRCLQNNNKGFTLIEVSIILVVFGILFTSFIGLLNKRLKQERLEAHFENVTDVQQALTNYVLSTGYYPLPANPNLAINSDSYGYPVDVTDLPDHTSGDCALTDPVLRTSTDGITCAVGARATGDGSAGLVVYIGALPSSLLGFNNEESTDVHGALYTYAVTRNLSTAAASAIPPIPFDNEAGQIAIHSDEMLADVDTTNDDALGTDENAHFVVVSHGQNHTSPYSPNSAMVLQGGVCFGSGVGGACTSGEQTAHDAVNGLFLENENSDFDATFTLLTQARSITSPINTDRLDAIRAINGPSYFDDAVQYQTTLYGPMWTARDGDRINMTLAVAGQNEGSARVIVGAETYTEITEYTDSLGNARSARSDSNLTYEVERPQMYVYGSLKTDKATTTRICDPTQSECIEVDDLTTTLVGSNSRSTQCIARGLKSLYITGTSGSGKEAKNASANGVCEINTTVLATNTLGTLLPVIDDIIDGQVCKNGSNGLNASGELICK